MKKFLMTIVAAFGIAAGANAQYYVGGGVGVFNTDNGNDDYTTYKFVPEVGYSIDKNWAVGVAFGWEGANKGNEKTFSVNPYARYTFVHSNLVNVFVDGGVEYAHDYNAGRDADGFGVGLKPGVAVNLNEKLSFVAHAGFLGYRHAKDNNSNGKVNQWGFALDGSELLFGLYYNF